MPDPTQHIGGCISYAVDPGEAASNHPGAVAPTPGQTTMAHVTIGADPRNLGGGGGTPWMFTFLKYCAGEVTTCALAGGVLTGPLSGCYCFRYQSAQGLNSIAHVGTDNTPDSPGTLRAKAIWNGMLTGGAANVAGEAASKIIRPEEQFQIARNNQNQMPILCAYFEGNNAWAVVFVPAVAGVNVVPGVLRIAAARPMPLLPWSAVRGMREWRD